MAASTLGKVCLFLGTLSLLLAGYFFAKAPKISSAAIGSVKQNVLRGVKALNKTSGSFEVKYNTIDLLGQKAINNITVFSSCHTGDACPTITIKDHTGARVGCASNGEEGGCKPGDCGKKNAKVHGVEVVPLCAVYGIKKGEYTFEASQPVIILSAGAMAQAAVKGVEGAFSAIAAWFQVALFALVGMLILLFTGLGICCGICATDPKEGSARERLLGAEEPLVV